LTKAREQREHFFKNLEAGKLSRIKKIGFSLIMTPYSGSKMALFFSDPNFKLGFFDKMKKPKKGPFFSPS
jgi:hypothetical protein